MKSYMSSKLKSNRPESSARLYYDENSYYDTSERRSRIPRKACSQEGRGSLDRRKRSSSQIHSSNTSMIPRPEWKKQSKKTSTTKNPHIKGTKEELDDTPEPTTGNTAETEEMSEQKPEEDSPVAVAHIDVDNSKVNEDFLAFKKNVLTIPEYWTDAGQTVTNILKNAVNIVAKQYPSADVETFETEIENILKATECVKQQILTKTENIIKQASRIYKNSHNGEGPSEEELAKIKKKMEDLKKEVDERKNIFGNLLKCSSEITQLVDLEKALELKTRNAGAKKKDENGGSKKRVSGKSKLRIEASSLEMRKQEKNAMQSCGDVLRQDTTLSVEKSPRNAPVVLEDKYSQTANLCTVELHWREEVLSILNHQILELHQLCKDHISKFKSFNLQIKLRGICKKAQTLSACREIQMLTDEKLQLAEKNNKLQFYNKDLESAIKQRDLDIHQKDRLISQQKKLLHVRDELIEMLKSRCSMEMENFDG